MVDLRTELAPLLDRERVPSIERIRAGVARRRRRRITTRTAIAVAAVAAGVAVWVVRPSSSPSLKTINPARPERVECGVSVHGTSIAVAFDLVLHAAGTGHIEGSRVTFTVVGPPRDGAWRLRVVATRSEAIGPFSAAGGFTPGRPGFAGRVRTNDGSYLTYECPARTTPTTPGPASTVVGSGPPSDIGAPTFVSSSEGWTCGTPLYLTRDDATTWQAIDVGTDDQDDRPCAFQPGRAWVAGDGPGVSSSAGVVRVVVGADPESAWVALPGAGASEYVRSIDFVDASHGWALTDTTVADSQIGPGALYRTVDGGTHWQRIAAAPPVSSGLRFSSATTGWAIGNRSLERTDDGGRTWRAAPIVPTPHLGAYGNFESVFVFGTRIVADGFLPGGNFGQLFTEVSNDDGAHWTLQLVSTNVVEPAGTITRSFVAVDATHWRDAVGGLLVATDDGGRTWRTATTGAILQVAGISFLTPEDGWETGCTAGTDPCRGVAQTTDGGTSWHLLARPF